MKNLHFSEKSELVSKLLACPSMKARETRKTILRQLRDEISSQIPFDERDNAYITNVVDTCLNYKGGLEELVDIIQYYERNSRSIDEIDAFLESMFPISIRQARLRELRRLIAKIEWPIEILENAYRFSAPPGIEWLLPLERNEAETCSAMLSTLADAPVRVDGNIPILIFVNLLIKYLGERSGLERINPQSSYHKLKRWLERTAKENDFKKGLLDKALLSPVPLPETSSSLLVALKEDAYDRHLFTVEAWLLDNQYVSLLQLYAGDERMSIQEVEALLDRLLAESRRYLGRKAMEQLVIEFSLPFSMMCCNVDHWVVKVNQYTSVKVGIEHRILVRSYDRAHDKELWDSWKSMWQRYQEYLQGGSVSPFLICRLQNGEEQTGFYARLKRHMFACLALTSAPSEAIFQTMVGFGIPIALWSRLPTHQTSHMEGIEPFLSSCKLSDLPELVWHQRMEAFDTGDDQHPGRHLTLLWDDPYRLPPDVQNVNIPLQAPRKGRKQ